MDTVKIGKFLSEMRRNHGLTQREFAELLGISDKTVSKWETGNGLPEVSLMLPVCEALHIDLNELFSGERLKEADYKKKAEENMIRLLRETEQMKANIVGGSRMGEARSVELDTAAVHQTNEEFWNEDGSGTLGVVALPDYGGYMSEENLHLLGNLCGKSVLEIACGDGRSLAYMHERGAEELWGIDLSQKQLDRAQAFLSSRNIPANLLCTPMERACGLPPQHFDMVYSLFGIGWTTDLDATFGKINACLKPGGVFLFSWSHPIHKCTLYQNGRLVFVNSYFDESWYSAAIGGREIMLANRMLSTYINALAENGFRIEKLVEKGDAERLRADGGVFAEKAQTVPVCFVIRARKAD